MPPKAKQLKQQSPPTTTTTTSSSIAQIWSAFLDRINAKHHGVFLTLLFGVLLRWSIGLGGYSGQGVEPMHGDFEAQRHWPEITLHLPANEWYFYDLEYWGLDYPPLTAYHSWLIGWVGSFFNTEWFAFTTSRGYESQGLKNYMRLTALVSEYLIYVPAVYWFVNSMVPKNKFVEKNSLFLLLILHPSLQLVDHGHFQYNAVMLGFTLLAITALINSRYVLGSIFFVLALGFKQMALYYSLPIFVFLLGRCFRREFGLSLLIKLGVTVILSFSALVLPFIFPTSDAKTQLSQIMIRMFPFARGLYEDKVANFWCAISMVVKLKTFVETDNLVKLSALVTLVVAIPSLLHLFITSIRTPFSSTPNPRLTHIFLHSLLITSLSFFLFSFQVHEKTILLPLLPVMLLYIDHPLGVWMTLLANFSMEPLLKKDGQLISYIAMTIFWTWMHGNKLWNSMTRTNWFLRFCIWSTCIGAIVVHVLEMTSSPPSRYPDLWTMFNVVISCGGFMVFLLWAYVRQFSFGSTEQGKKKVQ